MSCNRLGTGSVQCMPGFTVQLRVDGAPIGAVECAAIKACKDLPVSQSQGKWVSRGGNGGDGGFMEIKLRIKDSWRSRMKEVKAMTICRRKITFCPHHLLEEKDSWRS